MIRKNKVCILRGFDELANIITSSPKERVNVDHVIATVALKFPEYWPPEMGNGPSLAELHNRIQQFAEYLHMTEYSYCMFAEYATVLNDRDEVRVVSGLCLKIDWLRNAIVGIHKQRGQKILDINRNKNDIYIDNQPGSYPETISLIESWCNIF